MSTEPPGSISSAALLRGAGRARRLALPLLEGLEGVTHGFTVTGSDPAEALRDAAGRPVPLATLWQVHGRAVHVMTRATTPGEPSPQGDALLTERAGLAVGVRVADCVPILLCDPLRRVAGAIHAGWRGTVAGVLQAAIEAARALGCRPRDLHLGLGPAIGPCCFVVGPDVVEAWRKRDPEPDRTLVAGPETRMDLPEANRLQALRCGVPAEQISLAGLCTVCRPDLLESYRRSRGTGGRMTAFITL